MSKRELHLCDVVESGQACDEKYYKTCPTCSVECCMGHFGVNPILAQIVIGDPRKLCVSGDVQVCKLCNKRLSVLKTYPALVALILPITYELFVQAIRADLAGAALAAEPTK